MQEGEILTGIPAEYITIYLSRGAAKFTFSSRPQGFGRKTPRDEELVEAKSVPPSVLPEVPQSTPMYITALGLRFDVGVLAHLRMSTNVCKRP